MDAGRTVTLSLINGCSYRIQWGVDDCAALAANILRAQTGVDLMEGWRDAYWNQKSAFKLMRRRGGGLARHAIAAAKRAGWKRIPAEQVDGPALGIIRLPTTGGQAVIACAAHYGAGHFVGRGQMGAIFYSAEFVARCWQCPRS